LREFFSGSIVIQSYVIGYNDAMPRATLLSFLAILVFLIVALHAAAIFLHLYWTLWWYDIIVHFLGGLFTGLLVLWLRFFSGYFGAEAFPAGQSVLLFALAATLVVGIGWEIFERIFGNTWSVEGYYMDTTLDIIFDFIGGACAFVFFKRKYMAQKRNA